MCVLAAVACGAGDLRAGVLGIWGQAACLWFAIGPSFAAKLGANLPATLVRHLSQSMPADTCMLWP